MIQFETKEFRQSTYPFTGEQLVEIIKENNLSSFELHECNREFIDTGITGGVYYSVNYTYIVKFRKEIK